MRIEAMVSEISDEDLKCSDHFFVSTIIHGLCGDVVGAICMQH
jgi:hypothetical protein